MTIELGEDGQLLRNGRFVRLLQSRLVGQTATNAMIYAVLILLVKESGSTVHSTLLIVALSIPTIVLGIPGGTLADLLPRRFSLTLGYLLRAIVAGALFYYSDSLALIYILVMIYASIGQFFGPAEAATVPAVVRRDQLPAANSLMMLSLTLAQIAGMVVMAPILIKLFSADAVFIACMVLFLIATYIVGWLASDFTRAQDERPPKIGFMEATREGFRILRTNRRAYLALVYFTTAVTLTKVLIILLPEYTENVLEIQPEDTVFVAAPAAIGAALGLALAPLASKAFGAWRTVAFGFATFLVGLVALGLIVYVRNFILNNLDFGIGFVEDEVGVSSVITVTMLIAIPLGFAFTLTSVAARVVMNEQAPQEAQGRVFAVQMAIGDALSLAPLLLVGVVADVVGVRATLLVTAVAAVMATGYLTFSRKFGPEEDVEPTALPEPGQATQPG